jgi:hypothetical protein
MPGDGGVCGVTVEVLLDVVAFGAVELVMAAGVVLAVVLAGAAGAEADIEGAEVFVELVAAGVLDAVVEVPLADLLDLDFLLLVVVLLDEAAGVVDPVVVELPFAALLALDFFFLLVEVVDEVLELDEVLGVCDDVCERSRLEGTTPISRANKTEGTILLGVGKVILTISLRTLSA